MLWVYVNNNFRGYGEIKKGVACVLKGSLDKNVVGCGRNRLIDMRYN